MSLSLVLDLSVAVRSEEAVFIDSSTRAAGTIRQLDKTVPRKTFKALEARGNANRSRYDLVLERRSPETNGEAIPVSSILLRKRRERDLFLS